MSADNAELFIPVRNSWAGPEPNWETLSKNLKRSFDVIERWAESPFVSSAHIQDASIQTAHIGDAQIGTAQIDSISADKITTGTLFADVTLSATIRTGQEGTQRVELNEDGITLFDALNNATVDIPVSGDARFTGDVEASSFTATGSAIFQGGANTLDVGSATVIAAGVAADPGSAPTLTSFWDVHETLEPDAAVTSLHSGMHYDSTNTSFWLVGTSGGSRFIQECDADGSDIRHEDITNDPTDGSWTQLTGIVRHNTRVYVGGVLSGTSHRSIQAYGESGLGPLGSSVTVGNSSVVRSLTIGHDGSDIVVPYVDENSTHTLHFQLYDEGTTPTFASEIASSGTGNPTGLTAVLDFAGGLGDDKWYVLVQTSTGARRVYAFNDDGSIDAGNDFPAPTTGTSGLTHNGTIFLSRDTLTIREHPNFTWDDDTTSDTFWAGYTWVDDSANGSSGSRPLTSGDFESACSPVASIVHKKRSKLRITPGTSPGQATHVGFYLQRNDSAQVASALDYIDDETVGTPHELASFSAGGAAPPATTNFEGGTAASLVSATTGFEINGDGTGEWRHLLPPGTIVPYGGASAPNAGWLLCNGAAVSRTTYAVLFAIVGTAFGIGDGSTTFNLPDLRQRFPLGVAASGTGATLGGTGGNIDHTHSTPGHTHTTGTPNATVDTVTLGGAQSVAGPNHLHSIASSGNGTSGSANAPFQAVSYIIKT